MDPWLWKSLDVPWNVELCLRPGFPEGFGSIGQGLGRDEVTHPMSQGQNLALEPQIREYINPVSYGQEFPEVLGKSGMSAIP
ncbi:hypothetical protein TURU_070734 [Turdus rufiventris]|nr:hypothetical protein TURU_070734 [Turdus rufiventris]